MCIQEYIVFGCVSLLLLRSYNWVSRFYHQGYTEIILGLLERERDNFGIMSTTPAKEPEQVMKHRVGSVLGKKTILKSDHFPGCQNKRLSPQIDGAPNYRQVIIGFASLLHLLLYLTWMECILNQPLMPPTLILFCHVLYLLISFISASPSPSLLIS